MVVDEVLELRESFVASDPASDDLLTIFSTSDGQRGQQMSKTWNTFALQFTNQDPSVAVQDKQHLQVLSVFIALPTR